MLRKKTGFISSISTFYRGLRAQSDMKHLLLLSLDAENLSASAEWKTSLKQINALLEKEKTIIQREIASLEKCTTNKKVFLQMRNSLISDSHRRLRVCIPNQLADIVFPRSFIRYTIKYIRLCCEYSEFWTELFPAIPRELIGKQIRR